MKIEAPWTCGQVSALNSWQGRGDVHPFTCLCGETLIAGHEGWRCPACDYTQNWAHDFMTDQKPSPAVVASLPVQEIEKARLAVTELRDSARLGTIIHFRERDKLVMAIHNVLDNAEAMQAALLALQTEADEVIAGVQMDPINLRGFIREWAAHLGQLLER